ncbi:MAG TPA: CHRD domain-containing protein [Bryobacteraceae bacterium]|nr:CHRD domain-containing protein [Bryobacteraceae bacterium]
MAPHRGILILVLAASLAAQNSGIFEARLSAVPADARTRASLAGSGSASATLAGSKLTVSGSFDGLLSPATTAALHSGVAAGVRGPAIGDLNITKSVSGTITGSVELNAAQLADLKKGGLYVEIHSEKDPDGVLWGWLLH